MSTFILDTWSWRLQNKHLIQEHDISISGLDMHNMLNAIETCKTCNENTQNLKLEPYFEHSLHGSAQGGVL